MSSALRGRRIVLVGKIEPLHYSLPYNIQGPDMIMNIRRFHALLRSAVAAGILAFGFVYPVNPARQTPAPRPPMGWNSWDAYGTTVREQDVKANADVMASRLARYGWTYIIVDIQWYEPDAQGYGYRPNAKLTMDRYGRLTPALNRFPSAANGQGFKPLADYVHSKNLKFGIHIMRGIPRLAVEQNLPILNSRFHAADIADRKNPCAWNPDMYGVDVSSPGGQAYYDSIAALYASWGVDFVKADDMARPYAQRAPEAHALHAAIEKTGRPIVLSLSPGPAPLDESLDLRKTAQMWRISDDFWDDWKLLKKQFDYTRDWAPYIGIHGTWPDADMLPLGTLRLAQPGEKSRKSRLNPDEQKTLMTLWAIFRSPLILGADLPSLDAATTSLITNQEVLAVNQTSSENHQSFEKADLRAWIANVPGRAGMYLAVFNIGDTAQTVSLAWSDLGIAFRNPAVRDLWQGRDLGRHDQLTASLPPHASLLYKLEP
ncbi:MAG: glycoside hydrolase family 27 protein [Candidatus Acidiferrales bacterium]